MVRHGWLAPIIALFALSAALAADVEAEPPVPNDADLPPSLSALPPLPAPPSTLQFYAFADLTKPPPTGPVLIKGTEVVDPKLFPASFYTSSQGGRRCTSTLIGAKVVLTAAHCVANGGTIKLRLQSKQYEGTCAHSPKYDPTKSPAFTADYSLCLLKTAIESLPYESVNTDPGLVHRNDKILLTGYGCTKSEGFGHGSGGSDDIYRIGEAPVVGLPKGASNYYKTKGEVAVCFGDSGGPAFAYRDVAKKDRVQVSVNSRGTIVDESYLSSTSTPDALAFLTDFTAKNGVAICGVTPGASGCRAPH